MDLGPSLLEAARIIQSTRQAGMFIVEAIVQSAPSCAVIQWRSGWCA